MRIGLTLFADSPVSETVIFILQAISIFLGALFGYRLASPGNFYEDLE